MIEQAMLLCDAIGPATVVRIDGDEAMSEIPSWRVSVLSEEGDLDLAAALGAPATLAIGDGEGGARSIPLVVAEIAHAGAHRDGHRYHLTLSPWLHRLTLRAGYRVFRDKTAQEILAEVLTDAGYPSSSVSFRLSGRYARRPYTVAYGESDWGFMARLLAEEGVNVWFDQREGGEPLVVFGDGPSAHASIEGGPTVRFEDPAGMAHTSSAFFELSRTVTLAPERVHLQDVDLRQPEVPIEGSAGKGALEVFEFPARIPHAEAAAARAVVRLEQLRRFAIRLEGRSSCARLQPGRVVRVEGATDETFNGELLIVRVRHELRQASQNASEHGSPYLNAVELVPFSRPSAFRPAPPVTAHRAAGALRSSLSLGASPRVDGLETAIVTGPPGEEIHVDDLGRIKVRFPWDRSGVGDDRASHWVRSLQMNLGGSMILPRVGMEVPIAYVDGHPDHPFALGRVYNGAAATPYGMPGKKATTTLQSATSPGDGTTQEIRFSDDGGQMEAFIHATKDQTVNVGGTHTIEIRARESHDVQKSSSLGITGTQTTTVGANQSISIGGDASLTVRGAREESIGAIETIRVTGNQLLVAEGSYSELIGGAYALQCNQSNTVVQGAFTQLVGGGLITAAGLGTNLTAAITHLEEVGGSRSFKAAASYADTVKGTKKITAGSAKDKAGTDVVTHVTGAGSIEVGGSATIKAGGQLLVEAASITLQAGGSLTAKGGATMKLGGKLKVSRGKLKFDAAKTQKKVSSKVGR
ncbi:type VI secretion system Vgr family protein [Chondromyces apiculatus]|uniref:type VI secretion system Vgr family protein n=1 Tax=Chondromyces apiculatus TaxID=51 RepID=UPI000694C213|nr:type VI secretion system tip protein TssI/VgrG [Chondromyces apiculatus]